MVINHPNTNHMAVHSTTPSSPSGLFKFKGNPEPVEMVCVIPARLSGRLSKLPREPPKGKGNRLEERSGLADATLVLLPTLADEYRQRYEGEMRRRATAGMVRRSASLPAAENNRLRWAAIAAAAAGESGASSPRDGGSSPVARAGSGSGGFGGAPPARPSGLMRSASSASTFGRLQSLNFGRGGRATSTSSGGSGGPPVAPLRSALRTSSSSAGGAVQLTAPAAAAAAGEQAQRGADMV